MGPFLLTCFLASLPIASGAQVATQAAGNPIVIGHERTIESKLLGETRTLRIGLPDGYADSKVPCGVLYLLDGESLFVQAVGALRHVGENDVLPMIVVGINNTERTRDLTPPAGETQTADFPSSGGSAKFRRFIIDEVRPWVDSQYRTGEVRFLAGHSFGGLFTAETLLLEPQSFTGYLVLSPSFWWDEKAFIQKFETVPFDHGMFGRFAYFAMGEEDGLMNGPFEEVTWALKNRAPARFRWKREVFPNQDHWPAALPALGAGIKEIFTPIRDMGQGVTTFAQLKENAERASSLFGQSIPLGRSSVSNAVYRLSQRGDTDDALALIDAALEELTDEPYFYYSRANLLGEGERYAEAIETLERGIERFSKDEKHSMPVAWMKRSLVSFRAKLKGPEEGDK